MLCRTSYPQLVCLVLTILGTSDSSLFAKAAASGGRTLFDDTVNVRVVNVDVAVKSKDGTARLDLTQDEFVLFEDDQRVEIKYFQLPSGPDAYSESAGPDLPVAPPVHLVVYVDNYGLRPTDRPGLLEALHDFILQAKGSTEIALATFNQRLEFVSPFSSDLAALQDGLEAISSIPAHGDLIERGVGIAFAQINSLYNDFASIPGACGPCKCGFSQFQSIWQKHAKDSRQRVATSGAGLLELVRALGAMPGEKAVLFVGSGLEQRPGVELGEYLLKLCPGNMDAMPSKLREYDEAVTFSEIAAAANANRVTLYPLNPSENRAVQFGQGRRANLQRPLIDLADKTGGERIPAAGDLVARLRAVSSGLRDSYTLGFEPTHPADGKQHRLRVELSSKRRGDKVRFRQSYIDRQEQETLADLMVGTLLLGEGGENRLGASVSVRTAQAAAESPNSYSVPVEISIPTRALAASTGAAGGEQRKLQVLLATMSEEGVRSPVRQMTIPVLLGAADPYVAAFRVPVEHGDNWVAVGVRDQETGISSFFRVLARVAQP